jgi:DNA mismatch repair ATPase MutS
VPEGDEFIVMRDVVPDVPAGVRVVRETPAYRTVALELDAPALAAAGRRDAALTALAQAEEIARRGLAERVAAAGPEILAAARALGELDRTLARVAFTQRWGGCIPDFRPDRFAFGGASFVPLRAALADAGLPYTPISLDLRGAAVLTGPNMGGKSAALATCGFLALCAARGVPPPAEFAAFPLVEAVAWIGGEQVADRARLLSAFGGEVVRAREALAALAPPALVLVDEFARTTGPREGRALLVALVEHLARRGLFALVATHFDDVARDAGVSHLGIAGLGGALLDARAARDVHAALDAVARAMDYRIVALARDAHAHSDALALAGLLGLDPAIVDRATELYAGAGTGPLGRPAE